MHEPPPKSRPTRPDDISTDRRGFFRQIALWGAERAERVGRTAAARMGALASGKPSPPAKAAPKTPPPDAVARDPYAAGD